MRKHLIILIVVVAAIIAVGIAGSQSPTMGNLWLRFTTKLTKDNFLKIHPGMAHDDVRLILGEPTKISRPPGDMRQIEELARNRAVKIGGDFFANLEKTRTSLFDDAERWDWDEPDRYITIYFDDKGQVERKYEGGL